MTWNCAGKVAPSLDHLQKEEVLHAQGAGAEEYADIYVFSLQEIVKLKSTQALQKNDKKRSGQWTALLLSYLNANEAGLEYHLVAQKVMVG